MANDKLAGVHPTLVQAVEKIEAAMAALGFPVVVTSGVRTLAEQQRLYAQGRTAPGDIVTNADGIRKKSNHQPWADGYGHAVDLAFLVDGKPSWAEHLPWPLLGAMGRALGLAWGGDWKGRLVDRPHLELRA